MNRSKSAGLIIGSAMLVLMLVNNIGIVAASPLQQSGIQVVLQAQNADGSPVTSAQLQQTQAILRVRISVLGASDSQVSADSNGRIVVQLAGVTSVDQAVAALTQIGLLEFVDTGGQPLSPGTMVQTSSDGSSVPVPGTTLVSTPTNKIYPVVVTSADLDTTGISLQFDQLGQPEVAFKFDSVGTKKLADFTAAHVGKYMPIVLDKKVIASPVIQGAIPDGQGVINNLASVDEAKNLTVFLKYGALPVRLSLVESKAVDNLNLPSANTWVIVLVAVAALLIAVIAFLALRRSRRLRLFSNLPPIARRINYSAERSVLLLFTDCSCLIPRH